MEESSPGPPTARIRPSEDRLTDEPEWQSQRSMMSTERMWSHMTASMLPLSYLGLRNLLHHCQPISGRVVGRWCHRKRKSMSLLWRNCRKARQQQGYVHPRTDSRTSLNGKSRINDEHGKNVKPYDCIHVALVLPWFEKSDAPLPTNF